ncbi:MAG: hypothetical protein HY562_04285 [Ignavibacteriales bacterium]|nr:hypothetical protein [Ignavibacteriales bacterium]
MGQQQLILVLLAIMVIGIAIAAGLGLFTSNQAEQNKVTIINDINNIRAMAYKYRVRPTAMAGGAGSYEGFTLPGGFASNENANYTLNVTADEIVVTATSHVTPANTITVGIDSKGKFTEWSYTGDFQ